MPGFFKENVSDPVWTCRDPISLILGALFSLILGTRWYFSLILGTRWYFSLIVGTRIRSLKQLKKTLDMLKPGKPHVTVIIFRLFSRAENDTNHGLFYSAAIHPTGN